MMRWCTPVLFEDGLTPREKSGDLITLRKWQSEAYKAAHGKQKMHRFLAFKALGGSGKTLLACVLAEEDSTYGRKQLILVPARAIGKGFSSHYKKLILPNGRLWKVFRDFTHGVGDKKKMSKLLKEFLLNLTRCGVEGPVVVATHQLFSIVWHTLTTEEKRQAVNNLRLHIDECHHLTDTGAEDEWSSRLGKAFAEMLDIEEPTFASNIYSATHFRGDYRELMSRPRRDNFVRYFLNMAEYWPTLGIEEFIYDFIQCPRAHELSQQVSDSLTASLRDRPQAKHLIILPAIGSRGRAELPGIVSSLENVKKIVEIALPDARVLDLVSPNRREYRIGQLQSNPDRFDVVIACQLFDEGFDWPPCSDVHDMSVRGSPQLSAQIMGRAIRFYPGKKSVRINVYVQEPQKWGKDNIREVYSDRYNALIYMLAIDDCVRPLRVPAIPGGRQSVTFEDLLGASYSRFKNVAIKMNELEAVKTKEVTDEEEIEESRRGMLDALAMQFHPQTPLGTDYGLFRFYVEKWFDRVDSCVRARETKVALQRPKDLDLQDAIFLRDLGFDNIGNKGRRSQSWVLGSLESLDEEMIENYRRAVERQSSEELSFLQDAQGAHIVKNSLEDRPESPRNPLVGDWVCFDGMIGRIKKITGGVASVATYSRVRSMRVDKSVALRRCNGKIMIWRESYGMWVPQGVKSDPTKMLYVKQKCLPDDAQVVDNVPLEKCALCWIHERQQNGGG